MNNYQIIINGYHEPRKKLTTKETYALIDEYQKTKDEKIKEKLVNDNIKLVISMTKRFYNRSDGCEDLFQVGMIGLIKAIENFNTSYDLKFSTYAVPLIIGEMKRYLRDNHQIKISRSLKDIAYKILKIKDEYLKRDLRNNKKETKKKEQNKKENSKKDANKQENREENIEKEKNEQALKLRAKKEIEEYLASDISTAYLKTGLWNIPGSKRMRQQSVKEQNEFIKYIEKAYGQPLTKTQIKIIISKMAGKEIDDAKIRQFESKIVDIPKQKIEQICNLGMKLAEQDNRLYNTIMESEEMLNKLASMPKEYRDQCIDIISQALDKELSQFLNPPEESNLDKKELNKDGGR